MTELEQILERRGLNECPLPLWQLKLSQEEYESLKETLRAHSCDLHNYGMEAALCYAEWWRRDFRGNVPSKEEVAYGIGLDRHYAEDLFKAAKSALIRRHCRFIRTFHGTQYFRTLLNQGGMPINYIKNNDSNLGSYSRFLKGLVRELSTINYDWSNEDNSIIQQLNCVSYLAKSFKNENIYDVSMQIAHAIIANDTNLLPYDDTDASLVELTESLQQEYNRAKQERRFRPLSLHWKLSTTDDGRGFLFVNMDVVKDISSDSIPGLNTSTCYSFDIFVAGTLVGKYVRKEIKRDDDGNIINAIYTRISVGMNKDILWKGEPVVEVKVRCDNDERIFLTIAGCYPPNFEFPQVFQMLDEQLYSRTETANSENNIAIFSDVWQIDGAKSINIAGHDLSCIEFSKDIELVNGETNETIRINNEFTPYIAEFSGNYIPWVEESNYKLLNRIPIIKVYDKEKNLVAKCKTKYKVRGTDSWYRLNSSCVLRPGLVDIKVEFPDGKSIIETFYSIGELSFGSCNENAFTTEITCSSPGEMRPEIEKLETADIENLENGHWRISRRPDSNVCPSTCTFRLYNQGNPVLRVSVAIPFNGILITDVDGNIVPDGKIISFANLTHFFVTNHGRNRNIEVTYYQSNQEEESNYKRLSSRVIDGLVSLADYSDLIMRMFNLYGVNSFDRSSSVVISIQGQQVFIRKFVLESTISDGAIVVNDYTEDDTECFKYDGSLYAFPVGETLPSEEFFPIKLERDPDKENTFNFPEDFEHKEVVVFSSEEDRRRVIPKYFHRDQYDFDKRTRSGRTANLIDRWYDILSDEPIYNGKHWLDLCIAYDICSQHNLPFTTYDGLKAVSKEPKLLANFIIAMWLNEYKDVLAQDINRFEQEMVIALHWIPAKTWNEAINHLMDNIPTQLQAFFLERMPDLMELLQDIFNSTVSTEIAEDFKNYITGGVKLEDSRRFSHSDLNNFRMRVHGLNDINQDLPTIDIHVNRAKYYAKQEMPPYCKVMIESAMCAAENTCNVDNRIDLFKSRDHASIVNFYRKYFKETYSEIFFRTIKIINTK